jgi:dihydrolipoamide dehydrogenase
MANETPAEVAQETVYDVVIVGGGPGGYNAAIRAGQLGLKVACVEKRVTLGGTCLNVGCIPSKALLHASEMYEAAGKSFAGLGIKVTPELDLPQMHKQKDESVTALTKGIEFLFKKNKAEWIKGAGKITAPGTVVVTGEDGAERTLTTKNIVIATGSEPSTLPGVEVDQKRIVDSTGALTLSPVPKKLVVIGAGIIGLELGSVWRRLGAEVEVVEFLDRTIPGADGEVATAFQRALTKQGVKFRLSTKVTGAKAAKDGVVLTVEPVAGGAAEAITADVVLVCVGRRPVTQGLGLEATGVKVDQRGFVVTDHYKTSVPGIWAVGDVTTGPMLAHKAEDEAVACIEIIAGKAGHVNYDVIPGVIYTSPEVAWVGKTEEELKAAGVAYKVGKFPFTANSRAKVNHEAEGFVKVLADAKTDKVLGAHMIGPGVGEMIGEYCVAMEFSAASEDIARTCHPHPTKSEALRQAAMGVEGWTMQA